MGVFLGNGKNRAGRRSFRPMSEINVTPMVDVMLVLLVIFMVTAPLLTAGVPLDLPKTKAQPLKGDDQPLTVSVNSEGKIFIQETEVTLETLAPRLGAISEAKTDTRVFVRGHKGIDYGRVMQVMTEIQQAGFSRIALVSDSSDAPAPARRR